MYLQKSFNYWSHPSITRALISVLWFSLVLGPVLLLRKNKRAKCARVRANQNSPSFTLFSFSFHVSLRFSTERATTRGSDTRSKTLICTCQSKCEWKWDGTLATAGAEMLWRPHPTFESSKSQVSKAFLWKQKTIANRNQLFKLFEELLPTKRSSHLNKNRKSFGYRYTRCAISWIRFVLKAAFRTSKLSTVSKLMNESAVLLFTEDSWRTKSLLTVLSPSF